MSGDDLTTWDDLTYEEQTGWALALRTVRPLLAAIAAANPTYYDGTDGDGEYVCVFCDQFGGHDPTCPWRRASIWVETNPEDAA